jgi:2-C-methyl-D-erythritol 4-phosphate cytidylyltransferase / 2-C-methyl-D-erythritol 2,4-cyclodiphosphate synthase
MDLPKICASLNDVEEKSQGSIKPTFVFQRQHEPSTARPMHIAALIVAAGKGERAGGDVPKQLQQVNGKALVRHAVEALSGHPAVTGLFVVNAEGQEAQMAETLDGMGATFVTGGAERQDSVLAGLCAVQAAGDFDHVLIHDAARPFIPGQVIDDLIAALATHDGAIPGLPVVDTLALAADGLGDVVPRQDLVRVQTPQAGRLDALIDAHQRWSGVVATDDAQMLRAAGYRVAVIPGSADLEKITLPGDLNRAEKLKAAPMRYRTASGYDVHRLEVGRPLWLCGVLIPFDKGLSGHSDADVALHALTDALLGTIGVGDIGTFFPPSDPQWKGAASHLFLEHARDQIRSRGGEIEHVDVTIICEAPKIGPYRDAMKARIAEVLQMPLADVSVKATTTEKLGFTGRGEGIAAQAMATIRLKGE